MDVDPRTRFLGGIIHDVFPDEATNESIIRAQSNLGLVPSSPDGISIEHKDSAKRINRVKVLAPALDALAVITSEAVSEYVIQQVESTDVPVDQLRSVLVPQNAQVIAVGAQAIIANLIEQGILTFGDGNELLGQSVSV